MSETNLATRVLLERVSELGMQSAAGATYRLCGSRPVGPINKLLT